VNESAGNVECQKTEKPENEKNYKQRPKHMVPLSNSVHLVRPSELMDTLSQ
jgi:hypothetical protein